MSLDCHLRCFNSRTPGGVRPIRVTAGKSTSKFQFTHPGRGATMTSELLSWRTTSFNSRTPGGVRLPPIPRAVARPVSIHAPREGCDNPKLTEQEWLNQFQFTHPGRGATRYRTTYRRMGRVSIHAPREGCDVRNLLCRELVGVDVSIHAPREGCDLG